MTRSVDLRAGQQERRPMFGTTIARVSPQNCTTPVAGPASPLTVCALCTAALLWLTAAPGAAALDTSPHARRAAFETLVQTHRTAPIRVKLEAVNRFFNEMTQRPDRLVWGRDDHWATPAELLARGAGDCEDLAIGKYFALRRLGIARSALQITYMRDLDRDRPHMVLVYRSAADGPLVLDSSRERVMPRGQRPDLVPVYAFNEDRVTVTDAQGVEHVFPHTGRWRLRHWQALLHRVRTARAPVAATLLAQAPPGL